MDPQQAKEQGFQFDYGTRIDWSEVDAFGHVNNLAIMRYVQSARVFVLEELDIMQPFKRTGIGPILAKTSCQFLRQLYYPGSVTVHVRLDHVKTTSFQLNHVVADARGEAIAEAHDVVVFFDFNHNRKIAIPQDIRGRFFELGARSAL